MTIACAAVIGQAVCPHSLLALSGRRAQASNILMAMLQNNPLYLEACKPASDEEVLKFHYVVHCALDAVEEKGKTLNRPLFCI